MPRHALHACQCLECQGESMTATKQHHQQINLLLATLNHQQRRWYAAMEANHLGYGGTRIMPQVKGLSSTAIGRGRRELEAAAGGYWSCDLPRAYRGQKLAEERYPDIEQALANLLTHETAGNPMTEQRWVRSSLRSLSRQLRATGYDVSYFVVRRLLRKLGYTLRVNVKKRHGPQSPQRDEQFKNIAAQRHIFAAAGRPVISVDTKKKESIGNFRQNGKTWVQAADEVNEYDFTSLALCRAVPYGICDVGHNRGYVYVGTSGDTAEFAVDAIAAWWRDTGEQMYPNRNDVLILADGGGANGWRSRAWKCEIQVKLADRYGLCVTVCHYPTRCSKWNPVEYRLFSHISINWAGKPLRTLDLMLGYIRGTTTTTGLTVQAVLLEGNYVTSRKIAKHELDAVSLERHTVCPDWNYTIRPRIAQHRDESREGLVYSGEHDH